MTAPYEHMRATIGATGGALSAKTAQFNAAVAGPAYAVVDTASYASLRTPQIRGSFAGPCRAVVGMASGVSSYASEKVGPFHAAVVGSSRGLAGMAVPAADIAGTGAAAFHGSFAGPCRAVVGMASGVSSYAAMKTALFNDTVAGPSQAVVGMAGGHASLKTPRLHETVASRADHLRSPMHEPSRWHAEDARPFRDASQVLHQMAERHEALMRPMREASRLHDEMTRPYRDAAARIGGMSHGYRGASGWIGGASRWHSEVTGNIVAGVNQIQSARSAWKTPAVVLPPARVKPKPADLGDLDLDCLGQPLTLNHVFPGDDVDLAVPVTGTAIYAGRRMVNAGYLTSVTIMLDDGTLVTQRHFRPASDVR